MSVGLSELASLDAKRVAPATMTLFPHRATNCGTASDARTKPTPHGAKILPATKRSSIHELVDEMHATTGPQPNRQTINDLNTGHHILHQAEPAAI